MSYSVWNADQKTPFLKRLCSYRWTLAFVILDSSVLLELRALFSLLQCLTLSFFPLGMYFIERFSTPLSLYFPQVHPHVLLKGPKYRKPLINVCWTELLDQSNPSCFTWGNPFPPGWGISSSWLCQSWNFKFKSFTLPVHRNTTLCQTALTLTRGEMWYPKDAVLCLFQVSIHISSSWFFVCFCFVSVFIK